MASEICVLLPYTNVYSVRFSTFQLTSLLMVLISVLEVRGSNVDRNTGCSEISLLSFSLEDSVSLLIA